MNTHIRRAIVLLLIISSVSCKKLIDVDVPRTQLTPEKVFADEQSAVAVVSNIYAQFNSLIDGNITPLLGAYSDELLTTSADQRDLEYHNGSVSVLNTGNLNIWQFLYSVIYQSNALLENISNSTSVSIVTRHRLIGEARFLRALAYFYLCNIYGNVPLLLTTAVKITSTAPRDSTARVYSQIVADLLEAKNILSEAYPSSEKVRANKWCAVALLARTYLYQKNWQMAEAESGAVISSATYTLPDNINEVFLRNGSEIILQFWTKDGYTTEGPLFIPEAGSVSTYPITDGLVNSFEAGDQRRIMWIDSISQGANVYYYPHKYKNRSAATGNNEEYLSVLRLGEQYLIRAEARAEQGNVSGAAEDLNIIRNRAGLSNTTLTAVLDLLTDIRHERRAELFCEWGHRFFDLKRTGVINEVMSALKPAWKNSSDLLPIPQYERLSNANLTQNPGY